MYAHGREKTVMATPAIFGHLMRNLIVCWIKIEQHSNLSEFLGLERFLYGYLQDTVLKFTLEIQ